jgi:cysteinyl-tRNA synthetase
MDWTERKREEAEATLRKWRTFTANKEAGEVSKDVLDALGDDMNTSLGLSYCRNLFSLGDFSGLKASAQLLGLLTDDLGNWGWRPTGDQAHGYGVVSEAGAIAKPEKKHLERILNLISERSHAKSEKNYARADEIRRRLVEAGIVLEDSKEQTSWKVGRECSLEKLENLMEGF